MPLGQGGGHLLNLESFINQAKILSASDQFGGFKRDLPLEVLPYFF